MDSKNFDFGANSDIVQTPNCHDVIEMLGDYVEGDLTPTQHACVEHHLDECPECAAFFASYKHVIEAAAELREPERPLEVDVQNRLRSALNQRLGINLPYIA
jgi:anti-sigma factor RsiW